MTRVLPALLFAANAHAQAPDRFYEGATKMFDQGVRSGEVTRDEHGHDYTVSVYSNAIRCFRLKDWSFTVRGIKGGFYQFKAKDFCEVSAPASN